MLDWEIDEDGNLQRKNRDTEWDDETTENFMLLVEEISDNYAKGIMEMPFRDFRSEQMKRESRERAHRRFLAGAERREEFYRNLDEKLRKKYFDKNKSD